MAPRRRSENELRSEIVRIGRLLAAKDFAPATSGNVSARLDEKTFLITPTGVYKGEMKPEEILIVSADGKRRRGRGKPTSEIDMHLAIYEIRPEAEAVVHAHPPTATGFACAGIPLDQPLASEFVQALGCAPLAAYATPGTRELSESLRKLAKRHDAILLANHGVVTFGASLANAFGKMDVVEHFARVALVVRQLGKESPLGESDIRKLLEGRAKYLGLSEIPARDPSCPKTAESAAASAQDPAFIARLVDEVLKKL